MVNIMHEISMGNHLESLLNELVNFPRKIENFKIPIYDVIENEKNYEIHISLPGIKKEEISISTKDDTLIIKTERKLNENLKYLYKEIYTGKYQKVLILPDDTDKNNITAEMENGILKITIPIVKNEQSSETKIIKIK